MSVNPASVTNPPAQFPEDFVFGGATAAYQVEGETRTHGKGKVAWDDFLEAQGRFSPIPLRTSTTSTPSTWSCARSSASTAFASPSPGAASSPTAPAKSTPRASSSITIFAECHKHHVEPFVTLHHFDTPLPSLRRATSSTARPSTPLWTLPPSALRSTPTR